MFSFIFSKEESFNFLFMLKDSGTGQALLIFTNSFNCNECFLKCSSTLVPIQLSARKIFFFSYATCQNSYYFFFLFISLVILLVNAFYVLHGFSQLYQIAHLGDEDDEQECSSRMQFEEGETFYFGVRSLKNLVVVDQIDSLCPLIDCYVSGLEPFCKHFFFLLQEFTIFFFLG